MKTAIVSAYAVLAVMFFTTAAFCADQGEDPVLAKALASAPVSLEQGLSASSEEGKPISAKYEFEVDRLQLSVYTMSGESFKEVIVDHRTGRIGKVIPITDAKDLEDATDQKSMMLHAKRSLQDAAAEAVSANSGYRAVSAIPARKDGRLMASVLLTNGGEWKTVHTPLDWGD